MRRRELIKLKLVKVHTFSVLFVLVAMLGGLNACQQQKATEVVATAFTLSDTMMKRIELTQVTMQPVENELTLVGKVIADENQVVKVFPLVGGNVEKVTAELGDFVQKGQTLATIYSGEVADFERQMIQAESDVLIAKKNLAVTQDLYESKLNSQRDVLSAQKELEKAQAELNRMKEIYRIYGVEKSSVYTVKAPISGFILEKNINPGMQLRSDNASNIFTVGQIQEVWVMANVNESDIGRIKIGMDAQIQFVSYPDEQFYGKVDKIYNVLDTETKAMKVRIRLPNTDLRIKPEMHATVKLRYREQGEMAAVPARSIIFERSKYFVMVFNSRTDIQTREVQVHKSLSETAYIEQGVAPGERVISKNQLLVYDALND